MTLPRPIIDDCDIDNEGRGTGPELGCIECRETTVTRISADTRKWVETIDCRECMETLVEWRAI